MAEDGRKKKTARKSGLSSHIQKGIGKIILPLKLPQFLQPAPEAPLPGL